MQNPVDYFEIGTPNGEATQAFYGSLFGWKIADQPSPQGYRMVNNDAGGIWDTAAMGGGAWAIFYVHVDDVEAAVQKAVELGGQIVVPVTKGGGIEFAHVTDPQGNRFGIWKPMATTES